MFFSKEYGHFVLVFCIHLCIADVYSKNKKFDNQRVLDAVNAYCSTSAVDFCSVENLRYIFWHRQQDYFDLVKSRRRFYDFNKEYEKMLKNQRRGKILVKKLIQHFKIIFA